MKRPASLSLKVLGIKSHPVDKSHLIYNEWIGNKFINVICSDEINGIRFKLALIKLKETIIGEQLIEALNIFTSFKKINIIIVLNSSDTGVIPDDIDNVSNHKGCGSTLMINFNH